MLHAFPLVDPPIEQEEEGVKWHTHAPTTRTQVISRIQPTTVFVELCPSRAGILFAPQQQPAPPSPTADTTQQQSPAADGGREQTESQTTNTPASASPIVAATVVQAEKAPSTMSQISELLRRRKEGANILHLIISMGMASRSLRTYPTKH